MAIWGENPRARSKLYGDLAILNALLHFSDSPLRYSIFANIQSLHLVNCLYAPIGDLTIFIGIAFKNINMFFIFSHSFTGARSRVNIKDLQLARMAVRNVNDGNVNVGNLGVGNLIRGIKNGFLKHFLIFTPFSITSILYQIASTYRKPLSRLL